MGAPNVIHLTQDALWLVLILSGPPIVVASIVGLVVAFLQAATQLQEQTFSYTMKFLAIVITIFFTATLLGGAIYNFSDKLFTEFPSMVR
jgi:type III secretion protein S